VNPSQERAIRTVIGLLAAREYEALASMTGNRRLTSSQIKDSVEVYGGTIVVPPGGLPQGIGEVPVRGDPNVLFVVMPMWMAEEGPSDLSLEMTLITNSMGFVDVEIGGLHVL
jgi:hypothetical protein